MPEMKKKKNLGKDHGTVPGVHMVEAIVLTPQARQDSSKGHWEEHSKKIVPSYLD